MHHFRAARDDERERSGGLYNISCRDTALCHKKLKQCLKISVKFLPCCGHC